MNPPSREDLITALTLAVLVIGLFLVVIMLIGR